MHVAAVLLRRGLFMLKMAAKRMFDIATASVGLVILSPVFLVIAVQIKRDDHGPVFFRQRRVGRHGRAFNILKFRTMVVDAEKLGLQITSRSDQRITRIGKTLRRTKLDELPQLINVVTGDMSIVGARPEVPHYVELWPESERVVILALRPGITDPATIEFRDEETILAQSPDPEKAYVSEILPRKVALYLRYARGHSFLGDLGIIIQTLRLLSRSRG